MSVESTRRLTAEQADALALEGRNLIRASRTSSGFDYDITGFRRIPRRNTPFGTFKTWDFQPPPRPTPRRRPECASTESYLFRIAGFGRGALMSGDAAGEVLRENNVVYVTGPGNSEMESLLIARKYGLRPCFDLVPPSLTSPLTAKQQDEFRELWTKQIEEMCERLRELGDRVGLDLLNDPEQLWVVLTGPEIQPLDVFLDRTAEGFTEANDDFRNIYGVDLPPLSSGDLETESPTSVAARVRFWEYVRRRYSEIAIIQTDVCRKYLNGRMVGNIEFDIEVDYPLWGKAFDLPGFNMRTALFEDEVGYRYWVGFGTRLSADLSHRAPFVSVRTNLVAAGCRMIPTRSATREWYSQAVRNGAAGFFLWVRDYPANKTSPSSYAGPCLGNPDPSTLSEQRWSTHLEAARQLGCTSAFQPPRAETGILVSIPSCAAGQWTSVFSAYVEITRANIFARFVSTEELRSGSSELEGLSLLFAPAMKFEHGAVVERLLEAVHAGLTLVIGDADSFLYDENGDPNPLRSALTGVDHFSPREAGGGVVFDDSEIQLTYKSYVAGSSLRCGPNCESIGRYEDGEVAVTKHRVGRGWVITAGAPLLDFYTAGLRDLEQEDTSRLELLRHWHRCSGARDDSWIFDVDIDNVAEVTGVATPQLRKMDETVNLLPFADD